MKVLYDGYIYSLQVAGGINRFFSKIISGLPNDYYPYLSTFNVRRVNYPGHQNLKICFFPGFKPRKICKAVSGRLLDHTYNTLDYDIFHPSYYQLLCHQSLDTIKKPTVITVWDMIHEIYPKALDPFGIEAQAKRKALSAADMIMCISENTKRDLLERYAFLPQDKISVAYLASGLSIEHSYGKYQTPSRPYFLYVGSRAPYKNFSTLLRAFSIVCQTNSEICLCAVGAPFKKDEIKEIHNLNLQQRVQNWGYINDDHLAKLYRCSLAHVYPSLYEGFGIPPLEAMACGTVAIASDTSSIPEVVGDAGVLFDPENLDSLIEAMLLVVSKSSLRVDLIKRGLERASLFSWEKTVKSVTEIYAKLAP